MKGLNKFMGFDWEKFSEGKEYTVTGCSEWTDFNTKQHLGTKIEVIISKDETDYRMKDGSTTSNLYERLIFKVEKDVKIPTGVKVTLVNPTVTAYGKNKDGSFSNFLNCLSVKCEDIITV